MTTITENKRSFPGLWLLAKTVQSEKLLNDVDQVIFDAIAQLNEDTHQEQIDELHDLGHQIQIKKSVIYKELHYPDLHGGGCGCVDCSPESHFDYEL